MSAIINLIKASVIQMADKLNRMHDPFDEFTRPIIRRTNETLASKALRFDAQMKESFLLPNGVYSYNKVYPGEKLDLGDQALWHGIYTAMWGFKYAVTKNEADRETLFNSAQAQGNHIRNGSLIRGRDPFAQATEVFADDASNDSLTGFLAGCYFAWKHGDGPTRLVAQRNLSQVAYSILNNKNAMIKQDGTPTTYGQLVYSGGIINGLKTDPLRLTLCLAVYAVMDAMTCEVVWNTAANNLLENYWELIGFPKVKFLWWDTKYDTHRAALHLLILKDCLKKTPAQGRCEWGLKRIWDMEHKGMDPWLASLCGPPEAKAVAQRLHEYEFDERGMQVEQVNSTFSDYWKKLGVRFIVWDNQWRASQPLPFWRMGSQDFFPQRDLFSVDNWQGQTDRRLRYNGGDFLASYWRMRSLGVISPEE